MSFRRSNVKRFQCATIVCKRKEREKVRSCTPSNFHRYKQHHTYIFIKNKHVLIFNYILGGGSRATRVTIVATALIWFLGFLCAVPAAAGSYVRVFQVNPTTQVIIINENLIKFKTLSVSFQTRQKCFFIIFCQKKISKLSKRSWNLSTRVFHKFTSLLTCHERMKFSYLFDMHTRIVLILYVFPFTICVGRRELWSFTCI